MAKNNKDTKIRHFRLAVFDDKSHKQLLVTHFSKTALVIAIITIFVTFCAIIYSAIAYTPIRTLIPGYPDAHSKRAAIQNAIKVDSLEKVIFRWELYSENLKRVLAGEEAVKIDSILKATTRQDQIIAAKDNLLRKDSLLRQMVAEEEQFGISQRRKKNLPIEGMIFFTPVKGVVSQGYDQAIHPYIDIAAPEGTVVKAALDGTVIFDGWSEDVGHTIQIQHSGDIVSIYKHNSKLLKKSGDKVTAGTPIALVGNTGNLTTGCHLHFELWHKGETVDPTKYINF